MSTNETEKFQIQRRLNKMIVPCDKLSNHMFNYTPVDFEEITRDHVKCGCIEGTDRKGEEVVTPYWLETVKDYLRTNPLTPFDREVLFHAISAYEQGIRVISISMALDSMTGGDEKRNVRKNQYEAIRNAFDKLSFIRIVVDLEPILKAYPKYRKNYGKETKIIGMLLPCSFLEGEINGQKTFLIKMLDESPLMTYAKMKKQVLTYDATPLDVPNQNNTPQVMTIANYLLRRVNLIRRGVNPSILLETLYRNCGLENATKKQKQDARETIDKTLNHFKSEKVIENFTWKKQDGEYRSITIEAEIAPKFRTKK